MARGADRTVSYRVCGERRHPEHSICNLLRHPPSIPHEFVGQESEDGQQVYAALKRERELGSLYYDD